MEENGTGAATAAETGEGTGNSAQTAIDNASAAGTQNAGAQEPGAGNAAPEYDFDKFYKDYKDGAIIPDEFYGQFEQELSERTENGTLNAATETQPDPSQQQANDEGSKVAEWQAKLMADVGAKTPEELVEKISGLRAQISQNGSKYAEERKNLELQYSDVLAKLAAGDPATLAEFKNTFGKDFPTQTAAPAAQPAETNTSEWNPSMFLDEEVGSKFLNYVSSLENKIKGYEDKFNNYDSKISEFEKVRQNLQRQEQKEKRARFQSSLIDEIKDLAEKNADFYNLTGDMPVRDLISEHILATDNTELPAGYKPSQAIEDLFETVRIAADKNISLADAHKLRFFDKISSDYKLAASKPQPKAGVKPVGVMGATNAQVVSSPVNLTDEQINAMLQGKMDMPAEWFDDGMPIENKIPQKIYKAIMGQTA